MELRDVFVSGAAGRQALRFARRSSDLAIGKSHALPRHLDRSKGNGETPRLEPFGIGTSRGQKADLWFADLPSRLQRAGVRCHVVPPSLPEDAFVTIMLRHHDDADMRTIHCESPGFSVLQYARELKGLSKQLSLTKRDVVVILATYVMELTGTYAKSPQDPRHGQDAFNLEPLATCDSLLEFLDRMRRYPCVTLARMAVRLATDGAASRRETLMFLVTSLPPKYGGASLERADLNRALRLQDRELKLIKHRSIRPDLLWEGYRLIIEYDGEESHSAPKQKREDKYRIQDYQTLGYTVIPITREDVSSLAALDRLIMRIVEVMGRFRGRQFVRNKRRQLGTPEHRTQRLHLLKLLLPR